MAYVAGGGGDVAMKVQQGQRHGHAAEACVARVCS
jgi:hypothetical protein